MVKIIVSNIYIVRVIVNFLRNTKNMYLGGKMNQVIERLLSYGALY
jgi:hypothetical protein